VIPVTSEKLGDREQETKSTRRSGKSPSFRRRFRLSGDAAATQRAERQQAAGQEHERRGFGRRSNPGKSLAHRALRHEATVPGSTGYAPGSVA